MMTAKMSDKDTREDINKVFNLFDDDQTGHITLRNLKRVAKELGETMSGEKLKTLLSIIMSKICRHTPVGGRNCGRNCGRWLKWVGVEGIKGDRWKGRVKSKYEALLLHANKDRFNRKTYPDPPTSYPFIPTPCASSPGLVDAELLEMIERADTDQDGEINAEEFYSIMTKKTFT